MSEIKNLPWYKKIDWPIASFLVLNPLVALIISPIYFYVSGWSWPLFTLGIVFAILTNLSITAGYHRLFAHKSYEAHPLVRFIYLFIGSSAFQGSALKWSSDHRIHHSKVDGDEDPYSISKGFFYAHMGWLFVKTSRPVKAADLEKDWMVKFQHDYYVPVAILTGFIFPAVIASFFGSFWGGLLIAGALRIALTQQSTFFVNSLCHTLGRQPYSSGHSAKDSFIVAVLTHGEGYHNFHHTFQIDYRNGIKWYQWDPTKWIIRTLSTMGLAKKLRTVPAAEILKARLQMDAMKMKSIGLSQDMIQSMRDQILSAQDSIKKLSDDYNRLKADFNHASHDKLQEIRRDIEIKKIEFDYGLKMWRAHLRLAFQNK